VLTEGRQPKSDALSICIAVRALPEIKRTPRLAFVIDYYDNPFIIFAK
jgi:hypothetical protein